MTEDKAKRRAEPILSIVVAAQKDAEKTFERMNDALRPTLRILEDMAGPTSGMMRAFNMVSGSGMSEALANFTEVAARHMEPLMRFQKQMDQMLEERRRLAENMKSITTFVPAVPVHHEVVRYIPEAEQVVHVELSESHCEIIAEKFTTKLIERGGTVHVHTTSAQIDLFYNPKERTLTRHIGTTERAARFDGNEDNKRRDLFEKLAKAKRGIATDELKEYLGCPNITATYKVIQGLNKKMIDELGLTMNIVDGGDKGGYRIHRSIAIHEV